MEDDAITTATTTGGLRSTHFTKILQTAPVGTGHILVCIGMGSAGARIGCLRVHELCSVHMGHMESGKMCRPQEGQWRRHRHIRVAALHQ